MCAYKLVTVKFRWWGLQTKVESFIQKVQQLGHLSSQPDVTCGQQREPLKGFLRFLFKGIKSFSFFFFLNPPLAARKAHFHKLPPPALLLDRQMGGPDHGGHPADGGGDPERARGGNLQISEHPGFPVTTRAVERRQPPRLSSSPLPPRPRRGGWGNGAQSLITDVLMNLTSDASEGRRARDLGDRRVEAPPL